MKRALMASLVLAAATSLFAQRQLGLNAHDKAGSWRDHRRSMQDLGHSRHGFPGSLALRAGGQVCMQQVGLCTVQHPILCQGHPLQVLITQLFVHLSHLRIWVGQCLVRHGPSLLLPGEGVS